MSAKQLETPHYLKAWRVLRGLSQNELAAKAHIGRAAISKIEAGLKPLMQGRLAAFATALEIDVPQLFENPAAITSKPQGDVHLRDNTQRAVVAQKVSGLQFQPGDTTLDSWPRDLKIIGHVKGGVEGFFLEQGEHHGMAYRPPALQSVKDAFAVYVQDESMSPKFEPGEIAWVHPTRPVAPGNNVIIELVDGQAFIKRLVRRTAGKVVCLQWSPKREVEYDAKKVKRLYYVIGSYRED